jgi:hypothetical protein
MTPVSMRGCIAILTALTFTYATAAPPSIGTASARGSIRIDGSRVNGNATLFEGSLIETDQATTALRLEKGIELKLATDSRGKLYRDRLILEKGAGEFASLGTFCLEARSLKIAAEDPSSRGVVRMKGANRVEVAALAGGFQVRSERGLLLANVRSGGALLFDMQPAGATAPTKITGTLTKQNGAYFVRVPETAVVYEVTGKNLDKLVGKKVAITGAPDPNATPKQAGAVVIEASSATVLGATAGGAGAAAATGMALGTKLVIAGVGIAAATGTGVGIYESEKEDKKASRE